MSVFASRFRISTRSALRAVDCVLAGRLAALLAAIIVTGLPSQTAAADTALSEYQVKALFLLNFAKYVEWPAEALPVDSTALVIGLVSGGQFSEELSQTLTKKAVGSRTIVVRQVTGPDDAGTCHILFINSAARPGAIKILLNLKTLPVLTVGESSGFLDDGGVINFVKKGA